MSTSTVPGHADRWAVPGYVERRELARGASGRVVEAVQDGTHRRAAIRYLGPELVRDPDFLARFRALALKLKELDLPSVVRVYDYAELPGQGAAVVMELVDGISLDAMIERQGPLAPEAALTVLKASLLGLAAVHRLGFVHGAVKPENALVASSGQVKLTDFGLIAPTAGTPASPGPERRQGTSYRPTADVCAATAVFFECLTGSPPVSGDPARLHDQHASGAPPLGRVDAQLEPLIAQGLAEDDARRPHSANAFVSELEALAASAYGPGWEERGRGLLAVRAAAAQSQSRGGRNRHPGWLPLAVGGGRRRRLAVITAAAILLLGAMAAALALAGGAHTASTSGSAPAGTPSVSASPITSTALSATVSVSPASQSLTSCSAAASTFTFHAMITASKAGTVGYHWQLPSGSGPAQTVSFSQPGTQTVTTTYRPASDTATGAGTLVITSPGAVSSNAAAFTVSCGQGLGITNDAPTIAQDGRAYSGTVSVAGGTGPYTWSVTGLPAGLTASGDGPTLTISGDPHVAGTFTPRVSVRDGATPALTGTTSFTLIVDSPAESPLVISGYLRGADVSQAYSATIIGTGGNGTYHWTVTGLPAGLVAAASGRTLTFSGTPTASGSFPVAVTVSDTGSPAQTAAADLMLVVTGTTSSASPSPSPSPSASPGASASASSSPGASPSPSQSEGGRLSITSTRLRAGTIGDAYTATVTATGGDGTYTWSASGLPAGLVIHPRTGTISGTPTASGTFEVSLRVSGGGPGERAGSARLSLTIKDGAASASPGAS